MKKKLFCHISDHFTLQCHVIAILDVKLEPYMEFQLLKPCNLSKLFIQEDQPVNREKPSCTIVNRVFWFVNDSVTSSCTIILRIRTWFLDGKPQLLLIKETIINYLFAVPFLIVYLWWCMLQNFRWYKPCVKCGQNVTRTIIFLYSHIYTFFYDWNITVIRGGFRGGVRGVRPLPPLKFAKHMLY